MSLRRRSVLFLVGMVLIALLAESTARLVLSDRPGEIRWYDATTQLKVEQMEELGHADLVVAGTSMAWQAFVPDELRAETGLVTYNAGLAGGTPEVMQRWLLEEVVPRLEPTTVVWGLSSFDVAPAWGEQQRAIYDDALATRAGWMGDLERWMAERSELVANRTVLRSISDTFGQGADDRAAELDEAARFLGPGGERLDFRVDLGAERREIVEARLVGFAPSAADLATIEATVRALEAGGIEVVLAELPVPDRFVAAHPVGTAGFASVRIALADLAARVGVRFIAATDGFDDADFVDYTHLDQDAAAAFSRGFAAALVSGVDDAMAASAAGSVTDDDVTASGPIDVPPGCRLAVVEDEYGFEVEVLRCEDDPDDFDDVETPDVVRISAQPITDRFLFQFGCTGQSTSDFDEILDGLPSRSADHLRQALNELDRADEACGTDQYLPRLETAVSTLELVAGIDRVPVDRSAIAEVTSRAIAAVERLRLQLEQRNVTRSSGVWFHADEAAGRLWLQRRAEAGDPVRVVSLGDSVANYAIDQHAFARAYGGDFLNLAIAGADPEEWRVIAPRMFDGLPMPETILWPLTTHRLLDSPAQRCGSLAGPHLRTTRRYRRQLFPEFRPELDAPEMIMGPSTEGSAFYSSPAAESVAARYVEPGDRVVPEGTFVSIPAGEPRYPDPQFCTERIDELIEAIEFFEAAGSKVTVVMLPIHSLVRDQSELHAVARQAVVAATDQMGVELVELEGPYADEETFDGWHPNEMGQERVSTQLLDALGFG